MGGIGVGVAVGGDVAVGVGVHVGVGVVVGVCVIVGVRVGNSCGISPCARFIPNTTAPERMPTAITPRMVIRAALDLRKPNVPLPLVGSAPSSAADALAASPSETWRRSVPQIEQVVAPSATRAPH
jgi:hypothetical protein